MASKESTKIDNQCFNKEELFIDFSPKLTSTQAAKPIKRRRKRTSGVLQDSSSNDISNYWRKKKRNRFEFTSLGKGKMIAEGEETGGGDQDFYNNEAPTDIIWADDDDVEYSHLSSMSCIVNLKPIEDNTACHRKSALESVASSSNSDSSNGKPESEERDEVNSSKIRQVELILNDLISSLRVNPKEKIALSSNIGPCDKPEENNESALLLPMQAQSSQSNCDNDGSTNCDAVGNDNLQVHNNHDDDVFDIFDDDDWLSQVPDEALLLDEKAFVEKGDHGVISKALLQPRENVPVPKREEVVTDNKSTTSLQTSNERKVTNSSTNTMHDQENKSIPVQIERKTIPPQLIRRSKLTFINGKPCDKQTDNITRSLTSNKSNALGEVTNTLKSHSNQNHNSNCNVNKSIPNNLVNLQPKVSQPQIKVCSSLNTHKAQVSNNQEISHQPSAQSDKLMKKDDEDFEFDDDDDELFKSMELDLTSSQSKPMEISQPTVNEPPSTQNAENVEMEQDDDSFAWDGEEEADAICRNIDLSIFN